MSTAAREATEVAELSLEPEPVNAPAVIEQVQHRPLPAARGPIDMMSELLARGVTPEQLEKFLEVQAKHEAAQARKAYVAAMAAFKTEPIAAIMKKKAVGYTSKRTGDTVSYSHETLDQVVDAVIEPMAKHGLSHSWKFKQDHPRAGLITVWTVVTHRDGHSESVELFAAPDDSGSKNAIQQVGSTIHYLERYGLFGITGLAAKGHDNDGRGDTPPGQDPANRGSAAAPPRSKGGDGKANARQVKLIRTKLERAGNDEAELLKQFSIEALEALPFDRVNDALAWAERPK